MRIQIMEIENGQCGICHAQGSWVKYVDVYGTIGLYCVKCDTLTLTSAPQSPYVYQAFKKKCQEIRLNKLTIENK